MKVSLQMCKGWQSYASCKPVCVCVQLQPYEPEAHEEWPESPRTERWEDTARHASGLLGTWLQDNEVATGAAPAGDINLCQFADWRHVPLPERADCQLLCTHPVILAESQVKVTKQHEAAESQEQRTTQGKQGAAHQSIERCASRCE